MLVVCDYKDAMLMRLKPLSMAASNEGHSGLSVDQIIELVSICLKTSYFSYEGKYFVQKHGCAIGSPVFPIVTIHGTVLNSERWRAPLGQLPGYGYASSTTFSSF